MEKTYIFGHKKPDSDSVMSAIGLSYLENKTGENTEPRILGDLNKETKYAIDYFKLSTPEYLNDVKLQLKDVDYHKEFVIKENDSIYNGYQMMLAEGLTGLPIAKEDGEFVGLITLKDLSRNAINEKPELIFSSFDNILKVLKAEALNKVDEEIEGNVIVAAYENETFINNIKLDSSKILIVGDRQNILEYAIKSDVKMIVISGNGKIDKEYLELAKDKNINIIRSKYDTYHISRLITLANYIKTMIRSYNPTKFDENEFIDNILEINEKLKHTNYPVVDRNNNCLGLLRITDLTEKHPKRVILVDHNEKLQTADGIDEAIIQGIVDHHNVGSITTNQPINFRNMAVGSTCTIVYYLFNERDVQIPKDIAGALLSGILSDTLILKSPTATEKDVIAVKDLANIAEVDYEKYGMDMLKAGTSLEGMDIEDVLYNDFKPYTVNERKFGIAQFFTMNFDEIEKDLDKYIEVLDKEAENGGYDLLALYVTDIIKNGSYVIYNNKGKDKIKNAYIGDEIKQGYFIDNCVSRKKNVVPLIMDVFNN